LVVLATVLVYLLTLVTALRTLLVEVGSVGTESKAVMAWSWPHLVLRLRLSGTIPPLPHTPSYHPQGQIYLWRCWSYYFPMC